MQNIYKIIFNLLLTALFLLMSISLVNADITKQELTFDQKVKNWETIFVKIEDTLHTKRILKTQQLKEYRKQLRGIRSEAVEESLVYKEELKSFNELLIALGDAPEDEFAEDIKIRTQRKELLMGSSKADAQLKQANLIVAKSDELLLFSENYQNEKEKVELLTPVEIPFKPSVIPTLLQEFYTSIYEFDQWLIGFFILLGMFAIIVITQQILNYLSRFSKIIQKVEFKSQFSHSSLIFIGISGYIIFLFRFNIINFEHYPTLQTLVQIIASASLAVILNYTLGKVYFTNCEKVKDDFDEKHTEYAWLWNGIIKLLRLVLFVSFFAAILGYANLAGYITLNIMMTIIAGLLFFAMRDGIVTLNNKLNPVETKEGLSPLAITIIEPIVALISTLLALFFWGMTTEDFEAFIVRYRSGITIGDMTIDFAGVLSSIALFFALYYFTKLVQWFFASRIFPHTKLDIGVRDAVVAITGYIGLALAALASLTSLGFDMSKLAIVAGALSLGIGFGLQAIFNNFVSGLILLFERPVKVGDWIVVGDKEGIVKKVRVRSTEIQTFVNSTVILPNSQLISETVTNWMLHDKVARIDIMVGVAYGSDTEKVKQLLLDVAKEHPLIRERPAPAVLFTAFADSSLNFELRCFVRNVRESPVIKSDLHFAIDKIFREHEISIPFPQRDVHIIKN